MVKEWWSRKEDRSSSRASCCPIPGGVCRENRRIDPHRWEEFIVGCGPFYDNWPVYEDSFLLVHGKKGRGKEGGGYEAPPILARKERAELADPGKNREDREEGGGKG